MAQYNIIAKQEKYTVVSEYMAEYGKIDKYQSEAMLEKDFIKSLTEQGYEYLPIYGKKNMHNNYLQVINQYEGIS